jgi:glycosyltransferase involved in cell wall biosynthesis
MKGVSVVICCYNSSKRITETLSHLLNQRVHSLSWEVIVVDNASSDNTIEIAQSFKAQFEGKADFKVVPEPEPGLSHARKKGIDSSLYQYVLFCDDDNWLSPDYIRSVYSLMESDNTIGACGGKGIAVCEIECPDWFNEFQRPYAVGEARIGTGEIKESMGFLTGAGMCIRKTVWKQLEAAGFRSLLSDRKGSSLSSGGDLEICYVLKIAGLKLFYLDTISYQHFIPKERLTTDYLKKLHDGIGRSNVLLGVYQYILNDWDINKKFIWLRMLTLLTPKILKTWIQSGGGLKQRMAIISLRSYYKELWKLRGRFDDHLRSIKNLSVKWQNKSLPSERFASSDAV